MHNLRTRTGFLEGNYPLTCNHLDNDRPFLLAEVKATNLSVVRHHSISDWMRPKIGFSIIGINVITHTGTLKNNPETVKTFLRATEKGVLWTYNNPEKAVQALLRYEPGSRKPEILLEGWLSAREDFLTDYVRKNGLGYVDSKKTPADSRTLRTGLRTTSSSA